MDEPVIHSCPDDTVWRISLIQSLRHDPTFDGNTYTFHVEREPEGALADAEGAEGSDAGDGPEAADSRRGVGDEGPPEYFQVRVHVSPLYFGILALEARRRLDEWVTSVVRRYLDRGHRDDALLEVTSNGAVRHGDEVLLPERGAA